jgi:hypothetical protein
MIQGRFFVEAFVCAIQNYAGMFQQGHKKIGQVDGQL